MPSYDDANGARRWIEDLDGSVPACRGGQRVILPADLVEEMLAWGRAGDAFLRRPGFLGPALTAPDGADQQSQFVAFLGRTEPGSDRRHRDEARDSRTAIRH